MKVVSVARMREIDEAAQRRGIEAFELMDAAGKAITRVIEDEYHPESICIVCGKGSNAGDGFVVAKSFHAMKRKVTVVCLTSSESYSGAALVAWKQIENLGIEIVDECSLGYSCRDCDVIVDAILGTGLQGSPRESYANAIRQVNASEKPIVAADIPSGLRPLSSDEDPGTVIRATLTVTVGLPKDILYTWPGPCYTGTVKVLPLNFPADLLESPAIQLNHATPSDLRSWLPPRKPDSNKGTFGHVGIIGSTVSYAGAAILASRAALRCGCGLVTIYTLPSTNAIYKTALPESTSVILDSGSDQYFDDITTSSFPNRLKKHTILVVGPGLGTHPQISTFLQTVLNTWDGPLIIDADALNLIADGMLDAIRNRKDCLFTPHPGEMGRLLGVSAAEVQTDRENHIRSFACDYGITVLLKGAGTLVARPDGQVWIIPGAEPALAKGGTGDVLSGAIASLFAQGASITRAAILGATAHLRAGALAARSHGNRGVLASDVADFIPHVLDTIEATDSV